jgi:uncharacterized membrane protein YgcG
MGQKVLNEEQMREYVEQEVRKALMNEQLDEGLLDFLSDKLFSNGSPNSAFGRLIKDHMNFPDLMSLVIGIFGVAPIVKWLCGAFGINVNGPLGDLLVRALSGAGAVAVGDMIQNKRQRATDGLGGSASSGGGNGFSGGGGR